ncbi:MAG: hypothetical protein K2X77_12015 [Candidatus Obscuribacterales bacterium]|jgi:hypothetical protein|nr:hypothetical protein [Candidatus Obscuribacterales bacterium]
MPKPTTALLRNQSVTSDGCVGLVSLRNSPDGIVLEMPCDTDDELNRFIGEQEILRVVRSIAVEHHLPIELEFDRTFYAQSRSEELVITPSPISIDDTVKIKQMVDAHGSADLIYAVSECLLRADEKTQWIDKFSALWMAFSMLYRLGAYTSEREQVKNFLASSGFTDADLQAWVFEKNDKNVWFEHLARADLVLGKTGQYKVSDELKVALEQLRAGTNQSALELASLFLVAVYAYRCVVFHGEEVASPTNRPMLTRVCADSLDFLLRAWIKKQIGASVAGPKTKIQVRLNFTMKGPGAFGMSIEEKLSHMMNNDPAKKKLP